MDVYLLFSIKNFPASASLYNCILVSLLCFQSSEICSFYWETGSSYAREGETEKGKKGRREGEGGKKEREEEVERQREEGREGKRKQKTLENSQSLCHRDQSSYWNFTSNLTFAHLRTHTDSYYLLQWSPLRNKLLTAGHRGSRL